jgi:hypothetical protein
VAITNEQLLCEQESKVFVNKFTLLVVAFLSEDEEFTWMQEERVEAYKKSQIERRTF